MADPSGFPDHFSAVAAQYARFRPRYPDELFDWVRTAAPEATRVWDCAAGSGQATLSLAERFADVIATDASAAQVASAPERENIRWRTAPAESSGLDTASIDVVTVAQALHWFRLPPFWDEVRRVTTPGALFVAWTYGDPDLGDRACNAALHEFSHGALASYWPPERRHVDARYRTLHLPFDRIATPEFEMTAMWSLDAFAGYTRSWSATARYVDARHADPVLQLEAALRPTWGADERTVRWPLTVLAGRI